MCFLLLGLGACLPLNAKLAALDLFEKYQAEYKPAFTYSFFSFLANQAVTLTLITKKKQLDFKFLILTGLAVNLLITATLPFTTVLLSPLAGYIVNLVLLCAQGASAGLLLSSVYGLASLLPREYVVAVNTGTGVSALSSACFKFAFLFVKIGENKLIIQNLIFFAVIFLYLSLILWLVILIFRDNLVKSAVENNNLAVNDNVNAIKQISKSIPDLNFAQFVNFFVSFSVYPGVVLLLPFLC